MKHALMALCAAALAACGGGGSAVTTNPNSSFCTGAAPSNLFTGCRTDGVTTMQGCGSAALAATFEHECVTTWAVGPSVWVYGVGTAAQARAYAAKYHGPLPAGAIAKEY